MLIRQIPARWRGRDAALTDRGQAHASGPGRGERDGTAWGDERQVAVWGQVSARTLYLVVILNVAAGFIFNNIDSSRYGPCVTVFFAIAFAATAYAGWTASRKGVDVRVPRATSRARLVVQCLVFGVLLYVLDRFTGWGHNHDSWPDAAETIAGYALGWGIGMRFLAAWRQRQALRSREATDDDTPGAPGPMPWPSSRVADVAEDVTAGAGAHGTRHPAAGSKDFADPWGYPASLCRCGRPAGSQASAASASASSRKRGWLPDADR